MKFSRTYQFFLIFFAACIGLGVAIFVYREIFPEYKVYQIAYRDLEKFRSTATGAKPAPFEFGIKQIVIPDPENGPEVIDRCTSCHVTLDLPHFAPTRVKRDVNNNPVIDAKGVPVQERNPDFVWDQVDQAIADLKNPHLATKERLDLAERLSLLRYKEIDGKKMDIRGALLAHPLIGDETRPFEYHPMEEYGCTECHSGNGRALVVKHAHGPLYDGDYEKAYEEKKPQFLEVDPENDPAFARMYNDKPSHELAFQTTPLLAPPLLTAKCVQCHLSAQTQINSALEAVDNFEQQKSQEAASVQRGYEDDLLALEALKDLRQSIETQGFDPTVAAVKEKLSDYHLTSTEIDAYEGQLSYLLKNNEQNEILSVIARDVQQILGSEELAEAFFDDKGSTRNFVETQDVEGPIFAKRSAVAQAQKALSRFEGAREPLEIAAQDKELVAQMRSSVDRLIGSYHRGRELFISQSCYACHRIAGFSRSSVGPELTDIGLSYPWFVKEAIVWPQGDLPSSTMPNFRLDHEELADLMTFLMAQTGQTKAVSEMEHAISLRQWEAGEKMPWERPVPPTDIHNVEAGMKVYATEGCAACHKLQGFSGNISVQEGWFAALFPEQILGSTIVQRVQENRELLQKNLRIEEGAPTLLQELDPELVWGFYSNFKFASRALPQEDQELLQKVLYAYIQEYGLGRDIAPHLNWSGVYRSSAWLLGHFHAPSEYTARSIMPVMPFDDSKFYMLNYMLLKLGEKNRDRLHVVWKEKGFSPPMAYQVLCSQCHGEARQGGGLVAEWIYPIPKNLRNPVFLRGLTKDQAIESITHGVPGTPMPPWGESVEGTPVLDRVQVEQMVDWLYQGLPPDYRQESELEYKKWQYTQEDVVEEMEQERDLLAPVPAKIDASSYFENGYIREIFYTPENLEAGKLYFNENCAACHGKEGTGAGVRAASMVEAKPRMLANLPWIRSRDDLRLLRSIKYGVSGTSMVPWGDQTDSAMRMQLVLYIRNLTRARLQLEDLQELLYEQFDTAQIAIAEAQAHAYETLERVEGELRIVQEKLFDEENVELYSKSIELKQELEMARAQDEIYRKLTQLVKEERKIYADLGDQLIATDLPPSLVKSFFSLIENYPLHFDVVEGKLQIKETMPMKFDVDALFKDLIAKKQTQIEKLGINIKDPTGDKKVQKLLREQGNIINMKTKLIVQLADSRKLQQKQLDLANDLQ